MKNVARILLIALVSLAALPVHAQAPLADFSGQWSGRLHAGTPEGVDDTGILILDDKEAWLYGRDRRSDAFFVEYAFLRRFENYADSAVLILLRDGVTARDHLSQSIVLQLAFQGPDGLAVSWNEQNALQSFGTPGRTVETTRAEGVFRRTGFLDKGLRADREDLAAGRISREAILRVLDAYPREPFEMNDLARAEALLRFLGAASTVRRDAGSATGVFGPGEITFWTETYGKRNTFGIRYGTPASRYQSSNATYFEYR